MKCFFSGFVVWDCKKLGFDGIIIFIFIKQKKGRKSRMLEATFSPLIPTNDSEDFYRNFYNQFCFIQVNAIFMIHMRETLTKYDIEKISDKLNDYNEDQNTAAMFCIASGIMNESLMRRRKENRGVSVEIFNKLSKINIDPIDWYMKVIEFLMIYATCEQAIKDFLVSNGYESTTVTENKLINTLFNALNNLSLRDKYISELKDGSSSVIKSQNELIFVWKYYTIFRHAFVHAGGKITEKIENTMEKIISSNVAERESINSAMFIEFPEETDFFNFQFSSEIMVITDKHLNFFRNVTILIVESLERAIHPNEYEIKDFDPYKL